MECTCVIFRRPTADQALALAGVFQSAELVAKLATEGHVSEEQLSAAMSALLNQNPETVSSLYGTVSDIELGINSMREMINDRTQASTDVMRYVIGIMYLAQSAVLLPPNGELIEIEPSTCGLNLLAFV